MKYGKITTHQSNKILLYSMMLFLLIINTCSNENKKDPTLTASPQNSTANSNENNSSHNTNPQSDTTESDLENNLIRIKAKIKKIFTLKAGYRRQF